MQDLSSIALKDLVLVGGGHGHVHTIKMMGMNPIPGVRVTLISRDLETPYSGQLPGYIAGYYSRDECHIDLGRLCSFARVRLIHSEVVNIETEKKLLYCRDGRPPISYDVVSFDIGISPKPLDQKFSVNVTPVKPIDGFGRRWDVILERALKTSLSTKLQIAIVGGGAGGVELCFAINFRIKRELAASGRPLDSVEISLLTRGSNLLSSHSSKVREIITRLMTEKEINAVFNTEVIGMTNSTDDTGLIYLEAVGGRRLAFHEVIWCTQAAAQPWLRDTSLETTEEGFICVTPTLESTNTPDVFACGDVAHLVESPRPKAGVFAVRAGPPLTANLRRRLLSEPLEPWTPQTDFLGIIGTYCDEAIPESVSNQMASERSAAPAGGAEREIARRLATGGRFGGLANGYAVASKGGMGLEGAYLWKLKDRIDRQWMAGYQELPDLEEMMVAKAKKLGAVSSDQSVPDLARRMGPETIQMLSKAKMRCGGCGSKVGSQVLSRALARVRSLLPQRDDVMSGIAGRVGDDAAVMLPPAPPALMVHTIDYFRSFISDPYLFGQIAANHALSDVHAMNGDPTSALALCVLPYGPEEKVEEALVHMLAGALKVLRDEGCALVGGHTSEGSEPALGLAVNGTVLPDRVLSKGPLRVGHVLLLTKALGTGTILAADMRAKAKGRWVGAAISSMVQSNRAAAKILYAHGCSACTDVTGFGFLGHLIEMIQFGEEAGGGEYGDDPASKIGRIGSGVDSSPDACAVVVRLNAIPLLDGAADCVEAGILSSLHPQNIRCARGIGNPEAGAGSAAYPLLFDPQTSGGLLAAVPADRVHAVVRALLDAGYSSAAAVGEVVPRDQAPFAPVVWLER